MPKVRPSFKDPLHIGEIIIIISILMCSWYCAYTFGVNSTIKPVVAEIKPPSEYFYVNSNSNSYNILIDSTLECVEIIDTNTFDKDIVTVSYYLVFQSERNRIIIECFDDRTATAAEWKESIIQTYREARGEL